MKTVWKERECVRHRAKDHFLDGSGDDDDD